MVQHATEQALSFWIANIFYKFCMTAVRERLYGSGATVLEEYNIFFNRLILFKYIRFSLLTSKIYILYYSTFLPKWGNPRVP